MAAPTTGKFFYRHGSQNTASTNSGVSLPSNDDTLSLHKESSTGHRSKNVAQSLSERRDRSGTAGTEEAGDMLVEDGEDRKSSYDSTLSLDATPEQSQKREIPGKFVPLMIHDVRGHENDANEVPPSPGAGAAARLAEALQKLRQVRAYLPHVARALIGHSFICL
jgi:hypothetical protein